MKTLLGWLAFAFTLSLAIQPQPAAGWGWNPFAKDNNKPPTKNVSATRTTLIEGRKVNSPVSNQWRTTPPGTSKPSPTQKAMSNAADMITFKPLRNKLVGPPASQWTPSPRPCRRDRTARTPNHRSSARCSNRLRPSRPAPCRSGSISPARSFERVVSIR